MTAHCKKHGAGKCKINKIARKRPMGYFLRWLMISKDYDGQSHHMAGRFEREEGDSMSKTNRMGARMLYKDDASLADCYNLEGPPKTGEGREPSNATLL
jgi:hypothetical protein